MVVVASSGLEAILEREMLAARESEWLRDTRKQRDQSDHRELEAQRAHNVIRKLEVVLVSLVTEGKRNCKSKPKVPQLMRIIHGIFFTFHKMFLSFLLLASESDRAGVRGGSYISRNDLFSIKIWTEKMNWLPFRYRYSFEFTRIICSDY